MMLSKIFSFAVAAALLYLIQQQFPQEARALLGWMDTRVEALAGRIPSREGDIPDAGAPDLRAGVESSWTEPPVGDVEVAAEAVTVPEVSDMNPPSPAWREPPVIHSSSLLAASGPDAGPRVTATDLVTPGTGHPALQMGEPSRGWRG